VAPIFFIFLSRDLPVFLIMSLVDFSIGVQAISLPYLGSAASKLTNKLHNSFYKRAS
jgi:hypothetical protein